MIPQQRIISPSFFFKAQNYTCSRCSSHTRRTLAATNLAEAEPEASNGVPAPAPAISSQDMSSQNISELACTQIARDMSDQSLKTTYTSRLGHSSMTD